MLKHSLILLAHILLFNSYVYAMTTQSSANAEKIVIAHRGASGYLPEHTLAAKALAYAMGADYIEQDVVMTKDNEVIVLHDPYLERVTDVMEQFPDRFQMIDGKKRWLALDFTLAEIRTLSVTEGFTLDKQGNKQAGYPKRFPLFKSQFAIATLAEEIELIQGLNKSTGNNVGIYIELKAPWLHRLKGRDISKVTLEIVKSYGYTSMEDRIYIQCFDPDETRRIANEIYPQLAIKLPLIQLIARTEWNETKQVVNGELQNYSYDWMFDPDAMSQVAEYADGIGPWFPMLVTSDSQIDHIEASVMHVEAQKAGLKIHPYTFRNDQGHVPPFAEDFNDFLDIYYRQLGVDGVFTDYPDLAVGYLKQLD